MAKKVTIGKSVLETITVALYENPIILFREYVQNSLDAITELRIMGQVKYEIFTFLSILMSRIKTL